MPKDFQLHYSMINDNQTWIQTNGPIIGEWLKKIK